MNTNPMKVSSNGADGLDRVTEKSPQSGGVEGSGSE